MENMAFINVAEWTPTLVANWLQGLQDSILPYVPFFLNNNINGCRLLLLSCDDLTHLNVTKIGHQEIILDGVDLLKNLHYNFASETLQSLALRLGCKSRSLYNQLKAENIGDQRVTTKTLSGVCDILTSVKAFISWIDRYPFDGQDSYTPVRKTILQLSIELASTAQRDLFVENANDVIRENCASFAEMCDRIVQELNDSLAIQPASLNVVSFKKKADEELGLHIHSSYSGIHIVGGVKFQSPSHRCGRIEEGDEIVQINYQTVVGWQLKKLVQAMKEYPTEITLTIKKRPRHASVGMMVVKPFKIPNRKMVSNRKNGLGIVAGTVDMERKEKTKLKPVKRRVTVRRRATIGGSPSVSSSGSIICSIIGDKAKEKTEETMKEGTNVEVKKGLPYAKVHPLMGSPSSSIITFNQFDSDKEKTEKPSPRTFKIPMKGSLSSIDQENSFNDKKRASVASSNISLASTISASSNDQSKLSNHHVIKLIDQEKKENHFTSSGQMNQELTNASGPLFENGCSLENNSCNGKVPLGTGVEYCYVSLRFPDNTTPSLPPKNMGKVRSPPALPPKPETRIWESWEKRMGVPKPVPRMSKLKEAKDGVNKEINISSVCECSNKDMKDNSVKKAIKNLMISRKDEINKKVENDQKDLIEKKNDTGERTSKTVDNPLYVRMKPGDDEIYMSILDKEYYRVFGNKNSKIIRNPRSATSEEIASIYSGEDGTFVNDENSWRREARTWERCTSPISDNSLSSSSGISSCYSAILEKKDLTK